MSISKEEKFLTKRNLMNILKDLDRNLEGLQRKIKLYCVGGTELVFEDLRDSSKDIDFILSRKDFNVISEYKAYLELNKHIRIDLFPEGEMPGYTFSDYAKYGKLEYKFKHLELYYLDRAALVLMKILSSRDRDLVDIGLLLTRVKLSKNKLEKLYSSFKIDKDKKKGFERNFKRFIKSYFGR